MFNKYKRCIRLNESGHAHALTFSCRRDRPAFREERLARLFVESLDAARRRHAFDIWAYVIMPDHVHLVLWPRRNPYSISEILRAIKRPTSFRAARQRLIEPRQLWQPGGGYDRNLTSPQVVHKEIEYIHNNPVRKALCERPEQWTYSSAAFWAGVKDVPLVMDKSLPPRTRWRSTE